MLTETELRERFAIAVETAASVDPWIKQFGDLTAVMRGSKLILHAVNKDGTGTMEVVPMARHGLKIIAVWHDESSIVVDFRNVKRRDATPALRQAGGPLRLVR